MGNKQKLKKAFELVAIAYQILDDLDICTPDPRVPCAFDAARKALHEQHYAAICANVTSDQTRDSIWKILHDGNYIDPTAQWLIEPPSQDIDDFNIILSALDGLARLAFEAADQSKDSSFIKMVQSGIDKKNHYSTKFMQADCPHLALFCM